MGTVGNKIEITIYRRMESAKEEKKKHQAGIGDTCVRCETTGGGHLANNLKAR